MRRLALIALAGAVVAFVACAPPSPHQTGTGTGTTPPVGTDDFTSAAPASSSGTGAEASGAAGAPTDASSGAGTPRTVEEGDVYKVVGNELFVLNTYRGLQAIDITDPDHPVKQGTSPIYGYPVEMYVRDGFAYVVVSDYFTYWQVDGQGASPFHGSKVRVVDERDPAHPVIVGGIDLDGAVSDTRIVGDVLYVVANRWAWYDNAGSTDTQDSLEVSSIDLSNPAAPELVQQLSFPGSSNVIHVSPTTLYVASPGADWQNPQTTVTLVDIDNPHGALQAKGSLSVDGWVDQRFQLDEYDDTFRVVAHTGSWGSTGAQTLSVFSLSPQTSLLSSLTLPNSGELTATRFDGDRCYLVTDVTVDPLDVVDLRDPAHPVLAHSIAEPGLIQQISPQGNRLLTLGTDQNWSNVAASLFDVTDPANATLLGRVKVGTGTSWSNANWDDKALAVLPDQGLMLVPFSGYVANGSDQYSQYVNGFQIVSYDDQTIQARGIVEQDGQVVRVTSANDRLLSISDRDLQTVNATDLDQPTVTAKVELARDVSDFAIVGGHAVTLSTSGWWWQTTSTELRVTSLASPDDGVIGRLALPFQASRILPDGDGALLLGYPTTWDGSMRAVRVDLTDPTSPALVGTPLTIPQGAPENLSSYPQAAVLSGSGVAVLPAWGSQVDANGQWQSLSALIVVDVTRGTVSTLDLPGMMAGDLIVSGGDVWTTEEEVQNPTAQHPIARFYAVRIGLDDPSAPALAAKLNIPGTLVGLADSGTTLFTRDYQWDDQGHVTNALAELSVQGAHARLTKYLTLDDGLGRIVVDGHRLYATTETWWWAIPSNGSATVPSTLRVYESTPDNPLHEASRTPVGTYMQLRELAGGHLFLGSGYFGGPWELADVGAPMGGAEGGASGGASGGEAVAPGGADVGIYFGPTDGLIDYSLEDPDHPAFRQFVRTNGWVQGLQVDANELYVSGGIYGIESVALTP